MAIETELMKVSGNTKRGEKVSLLMANGCVVIQNGVITNNPFVYRLDKSQVSQWMVTNRANVMSKIRYWFREMHVNMYGGNEDDCFGYAVDYFTENKRRAFRKSYFGRESTYDVRNYCYSQLKFIVQNYIKDLNGGLKVNSIVNTDEMENTRNGVVDETIAINQMTVEDMVLHSDVQLWDDHYEWLSEYKEYFLDKNYKDFDIIGYLTYMYLDVQGGNFEEQLLHVAKKIGESVELVALVTDDFRQDVVNKDNDAVDVLNAIIELVEAVKHGWKPIILRS